MTHPRELTAPTVADQLADVAKDMLAGTRTAPVRAVVVEFYANGQVFAQTYGMPHESSTREMLAQVLQANEVLAGVAGSLNGQAAH